MKRWKIAVLGAAMAIAAGAGAALAPVAHGQSKVVRTQGPRALDILTGGARIGVSIRDLEQADAKEVKGAATGVLVEDVSADSPAARAGMRKGDVIVEFDGERVRSARQLTRLVQETPAGRGVPAVLLRDGQRTNVTVTPEEGNRFTFERFHELEEMARDLPSRIAPPPPVPPAPRSPDAPPPPPSVWRFEELLGRNQLGVTVGSLSSQLAEYFGVKQGVLVTSVNDDSAAAKAGLKAGDVITSLNGATVDEPSDVRRQIQSLKDGEEFTIVVMRDRKPVTLKGKTERTERRRTTRTVL
jgi:serine protease Do